MERFEVQYPEEASNWMNSIPLHNRVGVVYSVRALLRNEATLLQEKGEA